MLALLAAAVVAQLVPWRLAASGAGAWRQPDGEPARALAEGVRHWVDGDLSRASFTTGHRRFDGEWLFGTHMMAAMGFGQVALSQPDHRTAMLAAMDRCLKRMAEPAVTAFDTEAWGEEPLDSLEGPSGHVAYLGYYNLALSLRRYHEPHGRWARRNDAISEALHRRFEAALVLETYPGERYPVDNAAAIASLALRAHALGQERPAVVDRWLRALAGWRDPHTGLLVQSLSPEGLPLDAPRGSGTALAAYYLAFVDQRTGRDLYASLEGHLGGEVLGFGVVREYPEGHGGPGDVDSGPLIAGYSISATGFALASARRFGSPHRFRSLVATAQLFGVPRSRAGALHFATGGPIGDAILFAMLTAVEVP